jgi:hypothetical protein
MRKTIYNSLVAGLVALGSVGASYAAGGITTAPAAPSPRSTIGTNTSPGTTTGMSNGAGSAAAGANSSSNPSGNQLMPGSPVSGGGVGGASRSEGRR